MKATTIFTALALILGGCDPQVTGGSKEDPPPLTLDGKADFPGRLVTKGSIAFGASATDTLAVGDGHGYTFQGRQGGKVTITMLAAQPQCIGDTTHLDTFLWLFGPPNAAGSRGTELTRDDDSAGTCQSRITSFTLPSTGEFLIVASSYQQRSAGQYTLSLACASGTDCVPPPPPPPPLTFERSRIAQADIDARMFSIDQLHEIGDFLFDHDYTAEEGYGNGLTGLPGGPNPRPNIRRVHFGAFGGPDAGNCLSCHNGGGKDGSGEFANNLFQAGDGDSWLSAVERQPMQIIGDGYVQQLGIEMTADLQKQRDDAKAAAASSQTAQTVNLSSKGVDFGTIVVQPDGTIDSSRLAGVDGDLAVKPFGWKGRDASLRRFAEGGFRVHFGMLTQPLIAKHCATPIAQTVGTGPDCHDPDMDGVVDEITEGQLTAMSIYLATLQAPVRENPTDPNAFMRAQQGEALFSQVGCAGCHVPALTLNDPVHLENPDLTTGAPLPFDLTLDSKEPRLARGSDNKVRVELFSDLKRHDMGASLADVKATFGVAPSVFITRPLWGVAVTAPYMHDGRAPSLRDAVLVHDGEAAASRTSFQALAADDQAKLVEFLGTLSRDPSHKDD